jgi:hypothetical protein
MHPLMKKVLDAVFPGMYQDLSSQTPEPPGADTIPDEYEFVAKADAIAELSYSTGDSQTDGIHAALIDCVQAGYLKTVRGKDDGLLRFGVTPAGKARIQEYLGEMDDLG